VLDEHGTRRVRYRQVVSDKALKRGASRSPAWPTGLAKINVSSNNIFMV
jgi:hypothetical protein